MSDPRPSTCISDRSRMAAPVAISPAGPLPRRLLCSLLTLVAVLVTGCSGGNDPATSPAPQAEPLTPAPLVTLTVQVAGDVKLAEGLRLLRGEWKARTGGELKVDSVSLEEFLTAERLVGDVVIFPSRQLGALVERGALRPLRATTLADPAFGLNDIFPAIREGEMKFGGQAYAFPLGSPPLMVFSEFGAALPKPAEYPVGAPPTDGLSGAYSLILRGLGYTESYRRSEALFDPANMAPRIAEPQFVKALVELTAANASRGDQPAIGFAEAMRLVGNDGAKSTLGWPSALDEVFAAEDGAAPRDVAFAAIPPTTETYAHTRSAWERESNPSAVVLLGVEGRLVGVTAATRNAVAGFQLAQWLTTGDVATGLSSRSTGTLWYRASQAGASGRWMKQLTVAKEAEPVTKLVAAALATEAPTLVPRIPAIDEYLNHLAEAVRTAPADEANAQVALEGVAAKWEEITERLGREKQAAAYRRHLGETE